MEKNIRLAACYTVFNACELLHGSIKQIYEHVDVIIVCWQIISNKGNDMSIINCRYVDEINLLKKVHLVRYLPDFNLGTKENERRKHQLMIDRAKQLHCTHFFMSATDHYYNTDQFLKAKEIAVNYDLTASKMFTYYKHPIYQMTPIEDYYMPFIMKLKSETKITSNRYPFIVDPSVRIEPVKSTYLFTEDELMMHHYSMVRDDIESKFENSASAGNWLDKIPLFIEEYNNAKIADQIKYFKGRKIIEVDNYFNIK